MQTLTFSEKTSQKQSQQFDDGFALGEKMANDVVRQLDNASPQARDTLISGLRDQYASFLSSSMELRQSGYSDESEGVLRFTGICKGIRETAARAGIDVEN